MANTHQDGKKESKGIRIVEKGDIKKQNNGCFHVKSQSNLNTWYDVIWKKNRWSCNCMDYQKHRDRCKHVFAVVYFLMIERMKLKSESFDEGNRCPLCKQTTNIIKRGIRINRSGVLQRYYCKLCQRRFSERPVGFEGMKNRTDIIATSLDLYYRGLSLRQIVEHLEMAYKVSVSHSTIYHWIKKYVQMVSDYTQGLMINTSERWLADETVVMANGRHLVLWSLLDSETRFLIATHISQRRGEEDASLLLHKGMNASEEQPLEIVTDGLGSYHNAIKKEIGTNPEKPVIHLQTSLSKSWNNKIERFNGTIKSRTKTMAGFFSEASTATFVAGFKAYYNFIRFHQKLKKTPAMMNGVADQKYDWMSLIKKSAKPTNHKKKE
ncbi:DDE domain protein [uncultured archaeon]|nr:DDE domain protein [uncultured archaeon]